MTYNPHALFYGEHYGTYFRGGANAKSLYRHLVTRMQAMESERSPYDDYAGLISKYIQPYTGRWMPGGGRGRGGNRYNAIIDNTAGQSFYTTRSGIMTGTAPANGKWLGMRAPILPDGRTVGYESEEWIGDLRDTVLTVYNQSNFYGALPEVIGEAILYGTGCGFIDRDDEKVIHMHPMTWGQYAFSVDAKGRENTLYRKFTLTAAALVDRFGEKNVPDQVKNNAKHNPEHPYTVCHAIEPRPDRDRQPGKIDQMNKPWRSVYWLDVAHRASGDHIIEEGGYDMFPAVCPVWHRQTGETYGNGPGIASVGMAQTLQKMWLDYLTLIEWSVKGSFAGPPEAKHNEMDRMPGGFQEEDPARPIRSLHQPGIDPDKLLTGMSLAADQIAENFFVPVFRMLSQNPDNVERTAREIAALDVEKKTILGQVVTNLNGALEAITEITAHYLMSDGLVPPPPAELEGLPITIEFESILALAQKASSANADVDLVNMVGAMSETHPEVKHKIDPLKFIENYAANIGADRNVMRSDREARKIFEAEVQAQAEAAQAEVNATNAMTAKAMAEAQSRAPNGVLENVAP